MISRRIIRVKTMQSLYILSRMEVQPSVMEAKKMLQKSLDESRQLFVYLVHLLTEVARYAEKDARQRASKHLPTQDDLSVNTRLAGNELLWKILEQPSYSKAVVEDRPHLHLNEELVREIYLQLVETPEYQSYCQMEGREKQAEKAIMEFIYTDMLLASEKVEEHLEEEFANWNDDAEMIHLLMLNFLNKPNSYDFQSFISEEKQRFAHLLLETVMTKNEQLMELIKPKLRNWDAERIAVLDKIILEMGVSEFLFFETIPAKVTINEYIDLAKDYSTNQSGQFVNGILDGIHKELTTEGKLVKTTYRPV